MYKAPHIPVSQSPPELYIEEGRLLQRRCTWSIWPYTSSVEPAVRLWHSWTSSLSHLLIIYNSINYQSDRLWPNQEHTHLKQPSFGKSWEAVRIRLGFTDGDIVQNSSRSSVMMDFQYSWHRAHRVDRHSWWAHSIIQVYGSRQFRYGGERLTFESSSFHVFTIVIRPDITATHMDRRIGTSWNTWASPHFCILFQDKKWQRECAPHTRHQMLHHW